jgi:hypothetical protein
VNGKIIVSEKEGNPAKLLNLSFYFCLLFYFLFILYLGKLLQKNERLRGTQASSRVKQRVTHLLCDAPGHCPRKDALNHAGAQR